MAIKIEMVALSPTMESGVIAKWMKKVGDTVKSGDALCDVETDKATMEYESMDEGVLLKILIENGEVPVGKTIAILGKEGENIDALLQSIQESEKKSAVAAPKEETKASPTVQAAKQTLASKPAFTNSGKVKSSPLARKMAEEAGLDLRKVNGSGPDGRIIKRDIEEALSKPQAVATSTMRQQVIPVSKKRQVIAKRLAESKYSAPHYYLKLSIDMENTIAARQRFNAKAKEKLSMNAFLVKFIAEALKRNPGVNASWQGDTILQFGSVDIGLAVAQPDGLITPVVRNCESKGIGDIDKDMKVLIEKALSNKLQPDEYTNATFTISNLGSFGIEEFTAIINPPGSAILAIGKVEKTPVVTDKDQIIIRPLMKVCLSCDHRVIDGALAAAFLKDLKDIMEDPILALF